MRFLVVVLALAFPMGSASWAVNNDSPAEAWKKTDLDLALSKTFINNSGCNISLTYFESCIAAVFAANAFVQQPVSLITNGFDFEKAFEKIATVLPSTVPIQMMLAAAINSHLQKFDAHSYIKPAAEVPLNEDYVGIGIFVKKAAKGFFVTEVIEGAAAAATGQISFGDLITGVPGLSSEQFANLSVNDLAQILRGSPGTSVTFKYERAGNERDIKIKRARVQGKNLISAKFKDEPSVAYIRLREFSAGQSCKNMKDALRELKAQGVSKIILDLRGNSGGSTNDALCIAGLFIGDQELVGFRHVEINIPQRELISVFDSSLETAWFRGTAIVPETLSLAILVNSGSASASEILAGTLQSYGRAWLIGEKTFGKGSQQTFNNIPKHRSLVIGATTDLIILPNGKSVQRVGLTPSFKVPLTRDWTEEDDPKTESEELLFPTSLPALNGPWEDPRPDEIAKIRDCIADNQSDLAYLTQMGSVNGDYQRAYAAAVLKCSEP